MMPASLRDRSNHAHRLCWFSADSDDARVASSNCCVITAKSLKISLLKMPAEGSRLNSQPANEAQQAATPPRSRTPTPQPAAKSP
jgi:hypothetical protein